MNWIRLGPVTAELLVVCTTLFLSCLFEALSERQSLRDVQRNWGAIQALQQPVVQDGVRRVNDSGLSGPLDVWSGDWWRILVTSLHHDHLLHLSLCFLGMWYLGHRLEQRWGSFAVLMFLIPAITLPVAAELAFGQAMTGLSGAMCAFLGALVVLRQFSSEVREKFPAEAVMAGVSLIGMGWLTTLSEIWVCPNAAHLTGFCYGAGIAGLTSGPLGKVALVRWSTVLVHVWLLPVLLLVANPFWIGRYQWYQATKTTNADLAELHLEAAVHYDPSLGGAWLMWSRSAEQRGELPEAWSRLIEGLTANPSDARLIDGARRLWRHLDPPQRRQAEIVLTQNFGGKAPVWLEQIRAGGSPASLDATEDQTSSTSVIDVSQFSLEQKMDLPTEPLMPDDEPRNVPMNPDALNDAAEGTLF